MEASVAAGAGPAGGEGAPEGGGAQPTVDFGPVIQRVDQLGTTFESRLGQLEQTIGQLSGEPGALSDEDAALQQLQELFGGGGDQLTADQQFAQLQQLQAAQGMPGVPQVDAETLSRAMDALVEQKLTARMGETVTPLQEGLARMQSQMDADRLIQSIPELADEAKAQPILERAQARAQALGAQMTPALIEDTYKLMRYDQVLAGEVPIEQLTNQDLEPGSGASPRGAVETGPTLAQQMRAARGGNSFWGT
jgi:hypothetical protein